MPWDKLPLRCSETVRMNAPQITPPLALSRLHGAVMGAFLFNGKACRRYRCAPFCDCFLANQPLKPDFIWHLSYQRAQILYHAALNSNLSGPRPIGQCHPWRCLLLFRGKSARWGFIADRLVDTCPHLCNRLGDQKRNARGATRFGTNARL